MIIIPDIGDFFILVASNRGGLYYFIVAMFTFTSGWIIIEPASAVSYCTAWAMVNGIFITVI